jgi:hypothetical protein
VLAVSFRIGSLLSLWFLWLRAPAYLGVSFGIERLHTTVEAENKVERCLAKKRWRTNPGLWEPQQTKAHRFISGGFKYEVRQ